MAITLSVDIGGSNIKASTLDENGNLLQEYIKLPTPNPATPDSVIMTIKKLTKNFSYDQVAAGFPGYVRDGIIHTAPNLGTQYWQTLNFSQLLGKELGKPARVVNDADMLGLGVIEGKGFEMVVTLGTGFGTAFYLDGKLLPHLEISRHPVKKDKIYDAYIGDAAYLKAGRKKWNKRMQYVLGILKSVFNYDTLYLGGGNAKKIDFKLDSNIKIVTNLDGIDGGKKLWEQ